MAYQRRIDDARAPLSEGLKTVEAKYRVDTPDRATALLLARATMPVDWALSP